MEIILDLHSKTNSLSLDKLDSLILSQVLAAATLLEIFNSKIDLTRTWILQMMQPSANLKLIQCMQGKMEISHSAMLTR
jgi:hypothetical protein